MFDIALTNSGDFDLKGSPQYSKFVLRWTNLKYPSFEVNFTYQCTKVEEKTPEYPTFTLKFLTARNKRIADKSLSVATKLDYIKQAVVMQLRTEFGESKYNPELGCTLSTMRHSNIDDKSTLYRIGDIIRESLAGILDDPQVTVVVERTDGAFFCQNINIYIYDGDTPIYTFSL